MSEMLIFLMGNISFWFPIVYHNSIVVTSHLMSILKLCKKCQRKQIYGVFA